MSNNGMKQLQPAPTRCDFLVIGSGIAGLSYALHAASFGAVVVITKKGEKDSNTNHAQGGIACVLDRNDSFESHVSDTLTAGAGLCDATAVATMVSEGPQRLRELVRWGVHFSRKRGGKGEHSFHLGREGGHSLNRIVHADDLTGREIERALLEQLHNHPRVTLLENHLAIELVTNHHLANRRRNNRCYGVWVFDRQARTVTPLLAATTCIATGGVGQVYAHTTNPDIATGDGIAMAWRAGATIANMEFIQFHPTTLYHPQGDSFLLSEALRGYGATLRDAKGNDFMSAYHPMGPLAPRDIVARAIDDVMKKTGDSCVWLDVTHLNARTTRRRFPNIYARCRELGIDITRSNVPVVPAAHYLCGGIAVDCRGQSSLPGLFACGEASCTGVHGANRLASNSLLEAVVFSRRAALHAAELLQRAPGMPQRSLRAWDDSSTTDPEEWILLEHNIAEVRSIMWDYVGIVRSNLRLHRALRRIRLLEREVESFYKRTRISPELIELRNLVTNAYLIVVSALRRKESRGLHFTTDYPEPDDSSRPRPTLLKKRQR